MIFEIYPSKNLQVIFEREAHIEQMFGSGPFGKMSWFWFRTRGPLPFFVGTSDNRPSGPPQMANLSKMLGFLKVGTV